MDPPSAATDRTTPTLSSVPEAKTLVSVGELKRNSLRDSLQRIHDRASSILLFSLQWKDLEDHYTDAEASLKRRVVELEALEGSVVRKLKEAGRWARMIGDRAEAKIRVLEDKVGGLVTKEIEERLRTVNEVERRVASEGAAVCEEMRRRGEELDGLIERFRVEEEMIRRKQMDLGFREKFVEDVEKELEEGKREVGSKERELNEALKRIMSREKEIEEKEKEREVKGRREIEEKMAEIVSREKVVGERAKCAELKGSEFAGKLRELSLVRKEVYAKLDKVRLIEDELVTKGREMESRDKEIEKKLKVVELKEKMFEDWLEEIESKKKDINERLKEVRLKEKSLAECSKATDLRTQEANKNYEMKMAELKLREKRLEDRVKQIKLKEGEVNRITVEADLKKKTIENPRKVIEEPKKVCGPSRERSTLFPHDTKDEPAKNITLANGGTSVDGVLSSNGKALQIFLIENWELDTSFRHNVFKIIKASQNPSRLVLDALLAFYPSHDKRDNSEGKCHIFRKENCLLLLEELRNISPEIGQTEKDEAFKLSKIWYHSMKGDAETVNFFNLLAAYKLASSYCVDDLLKKIGRVRYSRKMLELCRALGFTDKIPGLVQVLMDFNNLPSAISFINAFELNHLFSVDALINKCIRNSADAANSGRPNQSYSIRAQKKARKRRLAEMNALMECIEECRIRSKHTERIREIIFSLGGHNPNLEGGANRAGKICRSTKLAASCRATTPLSVNPVADTTSEVSPSCQLNKQPKTAAPAEAGQIILDDANPIHHLSEQQAQLGQGEMFESKKSKPNELSRKVDEKSLKIIFGGEVDCDKAHEKAYKLLHASPDPARLVLGAVMGNISSNTRGKEDFKLGMPLKVCVQLLELLKRISPMISHQLQEDAKKFAMTWKSNLKARADDYVGIVCFLLFLSAFKVSSAFDARQIVGLLDPASWRKHVLHTCAMLGLKDVIPDFIQGLVEMKNWLHAMMYVHTFGMEDKFPLEPLLKDYMAYWENNADDLCKAHPGSPLVQMNAIEKMLTATRVTIKCVILYKLGSRCLMKDFEARMQQLEKQKADIAMKLKDSNIEHSDRSNSSAWEQETVEEPAITDNSPSACSKDDALISANVPTSAKAAVVGTSFSASSKDNAQVYADTSTFVKTSAPGNSLSASSNANTQVLPDMVTCSKDAESGHGMMTGGKRSWTSATLDHLANPQAKRQAQVPCWGQSAPQPYFNQPWRNCGPPLPQYPPVHHPYHPYQLRPPHIPGMIHEVPLQNGWPAPYLDPRNPYGGPHPHW